MRVGDLVVAKYDKQRDIFCLGLVLVVELREDNTHPFVPCAKVVWCSQSLPVGWHSLDKLELWDESRRLS